ncbi:MAG: glycosyltransferase [Paludibacteraceae bacterium]|nr:glycosyltransferase [Paludibacteraceae bacterium]
MNIRLSIIVPFYNVEKYIEQCIRSLYDQDIPQEEYEVICVDDCSPDGSRAIAERLQTEFPNLKLICHERNKKLGGARNTGLQNAKGEYIWFVDSDDYILPNCLASLLKDAEENNVDMLHFDIATDINGIIHHVVGNKYPLGIVTGIEMFFSQEAIWYQNHITVWQKLYRRSFLEYNNMSFAEDVFSEDDDYSFMAYAKAKHMMHVDIVGYVYRMNDSSIIHNKLSPIYVYSELKQVYRFSQLYMELILIDSRYGNAILGDVMDAIVQVNRQLPQLDSIAKQMVLNHISCKELLSISRIVPIRTFLLLLKKLYWK